MEYVFVGIIVILLIVMAVLALANKNNKSNLKEISSLLKENRDEINKQIGNKIIESVNLQQNQLINLTSVNETKLENIRKAVEDKLTLIQRDNSDKLEKMRVTVDEKLQGTLEKRLSESFKLVNDRLESVYKGLGEMQTLAQGVGDLKKVFTNVKSRGYWGEIQLSNILEQFLTQDQYMTNVKTKAKSNDFVEFAIKLPSKGGSADYVLLPVDSKFPIEDYSKLVEAEETGDLHKITEYRKALETAIKGCAKAICEKYLEPPFTTDFGIMFLPTESLYCEIIKNSSLCEVISQKYRVVVAGPSTFIALLNSLQMGFRTLAIEKRSSEVWELLGVVKTEFGKFATLLDKTNKKLLDISSTIDLATKKTRTIERKLKNVEALPAPTDEEFYPQLLEESIDADNEYVDNEDAEQNGQEE